MNSVSSILHCLLQVPHSLSGSAIKQDEVLMKNMNSLLRLFPSSIAENLLSLPQNIQSVLGEMIVKNQTSLPLPADISAILFRSMLRTSTIPYIAQYTQNTQTLVVQNHYLTENEIRELFSLIPYQTLAATKHLFLQDCHIHDLSFLTRLSELETLTCSFCPFLEDISNVSALRTLSRLSFLSCHSLQTMENLLATFPLRVLHVEGCSSLQSLRGIESFAIEELNLNGCLSLTAFSLIKKMTYLRRLHIKNLVKFEDSDILLSLPHLEEVHISGSGIQKSLLSSNPSLNIF